MAVWDWKTRIPQTYPNEIFYGKIAGGDAVLMEMQHFRNEHYRRFYKPADQLGQQPVWQEWLVRLRLIISKSWLVLTVANDSKTTLKAARLEYFRLPNISLSLSINHASGIL
jgi:hypothetical protein